MLSKIRFSRELVSRALGISVLAAILFVAGCTSGGSKAQFAVTTASGQLATAIINAGYSPTTLTAANGTAPYTWAWSGNTPPGMSLSSAGVLSGTPTSFGTFNFTVAVTDSATPTPHTATANLSVLINPALSSVTLNPTTVNGGTASTGTVTLTGAAAAAASVTLASNNASATVPATVTVAAGATTGTFQVTTSAVTSAAQPTITATYGVAKTAALTVNAPTVASPLSLALSTVTGGAATTGTVTLTGPAATGGDTVTLHSDNAAAQVPASVIVPAGQTSAQFNVTTSSVISSTAAHITATFNSTSQNATLTVLPALAITAPTFPTGVVGVGYTAPAFSASGGSGTGYTYTLASGSIAPLTINSSTGVVSGTPTTSGTLSFTVKVTDSLSFAATSGALGITINPAITVSLAPTSPVSLDQGKTQLITATVTNDLNTAGVSWSIASGLGSSTGSTPTTVTYNAPGSVASASTATVKATSITDPSKTATFTINLVPPPSITTTTMAAGNLNGAYTSAVAMTGGVAPYTWSFTALPAGLGLSASTTSTVNVTGTPTVAGANQTATIKVTDSQGLSSTSSGLTITVYPTLVITPPTLPLPTGAVNVAYPSETFGVSGGSGSGYTFSLASGSLPSPLTVGAGGTIASAVPRVSGTFTFAVKVMDSVGNSATTANISLTINPAIIVGLAPASPVSLDQGKTQLITATVTNDLNTAGVSWSIASGLGSLTGSTPTTVTYNAPGSVASASTATVKATSITDPSKTATFTINLVPPPSITTTTMAAGNLNGAYTSAVAMTGGVAPYTWSFTALPAGLGLSASTTSTVNVTGTPTVAGANQTATIKVTDSQGLSSTSSGLTITVYPTLVITPPTLPLPTGAVNVAYPSETFGASGGSGSGYTFSLASGSLPSPLTVGAGGTIASAVPTVSGTFTFAVKVMDSVGNSATTANISLTINPAISVTLSPAQPFAMDQNTTQLITATVNNDLSSAGVTWSALTGAGSLSGSTTSTITYNAPATVVTTSIASFTATSITDPSKSATFSVSLEPPPTITTSSLPSGTVGSAYSSAVTLSGGVGPYTWSFTALPAGLSLSSSTTDTVNIIGTPTAAGASQTVTIKVTDAHGLSNTFNSTITVTNNSGQVSGQFSFANTCGSVTLPTFTVTINTTTPQTVQTDSNGNYSFASVPNGTYTITPSITGASSSVFSPASYTGVVVNSGSVSGKNFSAVVGYNISGNVSYSGSQTGQTYLYLQNNNCGGNGPGTSITQATLGSGGAYTIHGVQAGNYTIFAWMDSTGVTSGTKYPGAQGQQNTNDPTGSNSSVSVTTASVTGVGVTMSSPAYATPSVNPTIQVFPSAGGVAIFYQPSTVKNANGNKVEDANEYLVQWAVTTGNDGLGNPTCALGGGTGGAQFLTVAGSHTFYAVGAHGGTVWILNNTMLGAGTFTSGQSYCFQARSFNTLATTTHPAGWGNYVDGNTTSPLAVKILSAGSALCSSNCTTVSGTVAIPSGVTPASGAPLYVGFYQQSGNSNGPTALYATEISAPVTGANSYSITIPNGSNYYIFGILDQNNDGQIDAGDVTDTNNNNNAPAVTLSGSAITVNDNSLPATNSTATVQTQYSTCGTNCSSYNLNLDVRQGNKLPVAVTLFSGPNLLNPVDMGQCSSCGTTQFQYFASLPGGVPNVGDTYKFTVTYSDGSVDQGSAGTINGKVTAFGSTGAVAGASDVPTNFLPSGTSSTSTTPNFTWTFPSNPSNYTYSFYLQQNNCSSNCTIWQIPGQNSNLNGFTYAQTQTGATTGQITWGTDPTDPTNSPSVGALTAGATYSWTISVRDANDNQAQASVNYAP